MANGSTGHLDEVYDNMRKDNGWLGGKGDSWEETPYWLDGAVPLAYLLNDTSFTTESIEVRELDARSSATFRLFGSLNSI